MPKFKYELKFNIADHDKWAAYQIDTSKDIFDTLDSLREWTNPDQTSSRNIKVLTMPGWVDTPFEVRFEDLKQTTIANGAVSFKVYDGPDDHARHFNIVLEAGTTLIRHQWLDPRTLSLHVEIWIVDRRANNSLVQWLSLKDEYGVWKLEDKNEEKK